MSFITHWRNRLRKKPPVLKSTPKLWHVWKKENRRWYCHIHSSCPQCGAVFYKWSIDHEPSARRSPLIFDWHSMEFGELGIFLAMFGPMVIFFLYDYLKFLKDWVW